MLGNVRFVFSKTAIGKMRQQFYTETRLRWMPISIAVNLIDIQRYIGLSRGFRKHFKTKLDFFPLYWEKMGKIRSQIAKKKLEIPKLFQLMRIIREKEVGSTMLCCHRWKYRNSWNKQNNTKIAQFRRKTFCDRTHTQYNSSRNSA